MTPAYSHRLMNLRMEKFLFRRDNLPELEELLTQESDKLDVLRELRKRKKIQFGPPLSRSFLAQDFEEVKREVCVFLGLDEAPEAKWHIRGEISGYNPKKRKMFIGERRRERFVPDATHEYTHFLQHLHLGLRNLDKKLYGIFLEGHARGVERHVAQRFSVRHDHPAFLYRSMERTVDELSDAYTYLCNFFEISPKEGLGKEPTIDFSGCRWKLLLEKPDHHALGTAVVLLHERRNGQEIYEEMIKGKYRWKRT